MQHILGGAPRVVEWLNVFSTFRALGDLQHAVTAAVDLRAAGHHEWIDQWVSAIRTRRILLVNTLRVPRVHVVEFDAWGE